MRFRARGEIATGNALITKEVRNREHDDHVDGLADAKAAD